MDKPSGAPHRCYCLHSVPPPSEPSAASPSPPSAAPLDLLYRRLWPLMLPVVREAAVAAEAPWPAVLGPPQAELWAPSCAYALVGAPRRCQPPPANAGQLLRRRRRSCAPARRARVWPVHLGPPLGHPRPPAGARGPTGAPPPLSRRQNGLLRPEQRSPAILGSKFAPGTSRDNSTKVKGLAAMS